MFKKFAPVVLGLLLSSHSAFAATQVWDLDNAHTTVGFKVRHMMMSNVRGTFKNVTGTVKADDKDLSKGSADFTLEVKSLDTGNEKRDQHLKSPDFFNEAQFPSITFKSAKIEKKKGGLKVHGFLTMHGETKPLILTVEGPSKTIRDPFGKMRSAISATAKLHRKDYGLVWNQVLEAGGVAVGEEIGIEIDAEFVQREGTEAAPAPAPMAGEPAPKK